MNNKKVLIYLNIILITLMLFLCINSISNRMYILENKEDIISSLRLINEGRDFILDNTKQVLYNKKRINKNFEYMMENKSYIGKNLEYLTMQTEVFNTISQSNNFKEEQKWE